MCETSEARAAVGPAGELFVVRNQTHVHVQASLFLPLFPYYCVLPEEPVFPTPCFLFVKHFLCGFSEFTQPSSITPRIRTCAFENAGFPSFPGSSFQLCSPHRFPCWSSTALIPFLWQQLESNQHQALYKKGCCWNDTINSSQRCSCLSSD